MSQVDNGANRQRETLAANADTGNETGKQPFVEPKLTYVEPKLIKRGDFADLTEAFFGGFSTSA
jgi:hypothetical protein